MIKGFRDKEPRRLFEGHFARKLPHDLQRLARRKLLQLDAATRLQAPSVPPRRINEIVKSLRGISADTALRLGRYFGMEPRFWLNLQARYDLEVAELELAARLEREVTPRAKAA